MILRSPLIVATQYYLSLVNKACHMWMCRVTYTNDMLKNARHGSKDTIQTRERESVCVCVSRERESVCVCVCTIQTSTSHLFMSHVTWGGFMSQREGVMTHVNASCHGWEKDTDESCHICRTCVTWVWRVDESYQRVISININKPCHVWRNHVTTWGSHDPHEWAMSRSEGRYRWVLPHMNKSCGSWIVMSRVNESCQI